MEGGAFLLRHPVYIFSDNFVQFKLKNTTYNGLWLMTMSFFSGSFSLSITVKIMLAVWFLMEEEEDAAHGIC